MKIDFEAYMDNSKQLFIQLFGVDKFNELNSIPLKEIDWEGEDITSSQILATCPSIKERFNSNWAEYYKERDITMFDLYIQSIYHYGLNVGYNSVDDERNIVIRLMRNVIDNINGGPTYDGKQ